jgi:cardiolipin synthase C
MYILSLYFFVYSSIQNQFLSLPDISQKEQSFVIEDTADTRLGKAVDDLNKQHPDEIGIVTLKKGEEAFMARAALAGAAEKSLDIQSYIWHDDTSGRLMFEQARRAADRGVRVRLLIDDNNTTGMDSLLVMLDKHPNIEVRLTNPFIQRDMRLMGYATDFLRLNRRMHNKSFTVDNQVTVIGGRNIGDEYFALGEESNFLDLDVIATGHIASDVSSVFDRYWNSPSAYPVSILLADVELMSSKEFEAGMETKETEEYEKILMNSKVVKQITEKNIEWEWAKAELISDEPEKLEHGVREKSERMIPRIAEALGKAETEVDIVSPYFVPGNEGTDKLVSIGESGKKVVVLTNSLAATDVAAVHAGYAKRRVDLLRGDVKLYELKPDGDREESPATSLIGSSKASLHAKTFAVDQKRIFIGSFNLDPRSAKLNTEMGVVIESERLAKELSDKLSKVGDSGAYEARLDQAGNLEWLDGKDTVLTTEPESTFWDRLTVKFLALLPIEWAL